MNYHILNYDLINGDDIRNYERFASYVDRGDKILHLAAVSRFRSAENDPPAAYATNVGGTANVLRAAVEKRAQRVVMASTGSVYMPVQRSPIDEQHPVTGNSHYAVSKLAGEQMLQLHTPPYIILRYGHLYGEGKHHGGLVDTFIDRIRRGADPIMYGGKQANDFVYISDVADVNILALETSHVNEVYNIGTGIATTTREAIDLLVRLTGYKGGVEKRDQRQVDAMKFVLDITKANKLLGYSPEYTFEAGLRDMLIDQINQGEEL
jgi:UDP-glucose 4-epimerase